MKTPQPRYRLGIDQLEDALVSICPLDEPGAAFLVLEQLEQELPQVGGRSLSRLPLQRDSIGPNLGLPLLLFQLEARLEVGKCGCGSGLAVQVFAAVMGLAVAATGLAVLAVRKLLVSFGGGTGRAAGAGLAEVSSCRGMETGGVGEHGVEMLWKEEEGKKFVKGNC